MLTIEIPEQIRQLVRIARTGEFPNACWASEIVSDWLWDITQHAGYDNPEKCPMARALCEELGIAEGHDAFLQAAGELYRQEAQILLKRALGTSPDKPAFLKVSAMVTGTLSDARKTIELEWRDVVPEFSELTFPQHGYLPLPVWQCLVRYYHEQWRDPIGAWRHDVLNWIRLNYELISYPADQNVPFPVE